jgi:hypothetical protein
MKKAINTEKSIFRYRVNVIKAYSINKIKSIFELGQKLYKNL